MRRVNGLTCLVVPPDVSPAFELLDRSVMTLLADGDDVLAVPEQREVAPVRGAMVSNRAIVGRGLTDQKSATTLPLALIPIPLVNVSPQLIPLGCLVKAAIVGQYNPQKS